MSKEIPLWVAVVIGLGPSVVAVVALVAAELRDWRSKKHERAMRLRDEGIAAYKKMLTATVTAHTDRDAVDEAESAYVEISLLASTDELDRAAAAVPVRYLKAQRSSYRETQDLEASSGFGPAVAKAREARDKFLKLAREELGIEGRTAGFRDLEGDDPGDELPGSQEPSSQP
jgi:uncharacterized coiled-coil DUF342 family protein